MSFNKITSIESENDRFISNLLSTEWAKVAFSDPEPITGNMSTHHDANRINILISDLYLRTMELFDDGKENQKKTITFIKKLAREFFVKTESSPVYAATSSSAITITPPNYIDMITETRIQNVIDQEIAHDKMQLIMTQLKEIASWYKDLYSRVALLDPTTQRDKSILRFNFLTHLLFLKEPPQPAPKKPATPSNKTTIKKSTTSTGAAKSTNVKNSSVAPTPLTIPTMPPLSSPLQNYQLTPLSPMFPLTLASPLPPLGVILSPPKPNRLLSSSAPSEGGLTTQSAGSTASTSSAATSSSATGTPATTAKDTSVPEEKETEADDASHLLDFLATAATSSLNTNSNTTPTAEEPTSTTRKRGKGKAQKKAAKGKSKKTNTKG